MLNKLIHLAYASVGAKPFQESDLLELLTCAKIKNKALGVTGMLLYYENTFFQVIEGDEAVIDKLFETIRHDKRHKECALIIREPIAGRAFAEWTMGYSALNKEDLHDILGQSEPFSHIKSGRARKLLEAFSTGRWRLI